MSVETFVGNVISENSGDDDWMRVHLTAGKIYTYNLPQPIYGGTVEAKLFDMNSVAVDMVNPFANVGYFSVKATGDYFFAVHADVAGGIGTSITIKSVEDSLPGATFTNASIAVGQTLTITNQYMIPFNQDWFNVDLIGGQSYVLSTDAFTSGLFFLDATGHEVSAGDHFTAPATGHYFAAIAPASNVTTYNLSLNAVTDDYPDLISSAGMVAVGSSATATFETAGDLDWFAVTFDANTSYRLSLTAGSTRVLSNLRVADSAGHVLFDNYETGPNSDLGSLFTSGAAGTYYIGAYERHTQNFSSVGYSLSVALAPYDVLDNASTTATVSADGAATRGSWEASGDSDWFKIDLVKGQSYDIRLTSGTGSYNPKLGLGLYDSSGHLVALSGPTYLGSDLTHTAEQSGTYYIDAKAGYAQTYSIAAVSYTDDYADNNLTNGRLTVGSSVNGITEIANDVDWFAVDLVANHTYLLGGSALGFFNAAGQPLTSRDSGDLSFTPVTTGTYYVSAANYQGSYTASVSEVYDDYVDNATTTGNLLLQYNGTSDADTLNGNDYPSQLNGLAGDDVLIGGASGDELNGDDGSDTLYGGGNADTLNGGIGDDLLYGEAGNDVLNGNSGSDLMSGGAGDDIYSVDNVGDRVQEAAGAGTDTIVSSITFSLTDLPNVENLTLTGRADIDATGNAAVNVLTGNDAVNRLISVGAGDTLIGAAGDDVYVVGDASTVIIEQVGGGYDTIKSSVGYTLAAGVEVEQLRLTSASGATMVGTSFSQVIGGGGGNDVLDGGGGGDRMKGADGNDTYLVRDANDVIVELSGYGDDTVKAAVSYTLGEGVAVEHLVTMDATATTAINLTGNAFSHDIRGNAGANVLIGGSGDDVLIGGAGDDVLQGLGGNDKLIGGGGADHFVFYHGTEQDRIVDFTSGTDKIDLSAFGFGSFAQVQAATHDNSQGNAVIDLGSTDSVTLTGVSAAQLRMEDVILSGSGQSIEAVSRSPINTWFAASTAECANGLAMFHDIPHLNAHAATAMLMV